MVDDSIKGWTIEVEGLGIPIRSRAKAHATIESYVGSTGVFTVRRALCKPGTSTARVVKP